MTQSRKHPDPIAASRTHRTAGVLAFVAACLLTIGGLRAENPYLLVGAGCQFVAWLCFVNAANRLEQADDSRS